MPTLRKGSVVLFSLVLGLFITTFCLAPPGLARTWNVPSEAATIQAGIDSTSSGDTVLVAPGTYYENISVKSGIYVIGEVGDPEVTIIDADSSGTSVVFLNLAETSYLEGFTLTNGFANYGGGVGCIDASPEITNCRIMDNHVNLQGGGILCEQYAAPVFTDCVIAGNTSGDVGGALASYSFSNTTFANCTLYGNGAPTGGAMLVWSSSVNLQNSIIAFGTGGAPVSCDPHATVSLSCSDVYGNAGGDWTGCIAGQEGTNGNFSDDPRFCDAAAGDFTLAADSPCLARSCGDIGAFGRGCFGENPAIADVSDIGNDQGRSVRLAWERTRFDAPGDTVEVETYEILRRQDEYLAGMAGPRQHICLGENGTVGAPLAAGWDYLGFVPAHGESLYQFVASTLCDSTAEDSICWSVFMVRATTPDPFIYFDSYPDSGYSVDNLAPAPPPGLTMASPVELTWEEVPDEDFDYYSVYGSDQPELDETAVFIGYTIDTMKDVTGHVYDYYHVTATDFSGNEGEESSVNNVFAGVPGMPELDDIPAAFSLKQNRPNPFGATTVIAFDVPSVRQVSLIILDARGRVVRTLADAEYQPGRHSVVWDGLDDSRNPVAPGIYLIRMNAGEFTAMKKVSLLR
jgi:hypothetical protein